MVNIGNFKSDLPQLHSIVQNTMHLHSKELILFSLRDYFSKDSFYRYVTDHFGYSQKVDVTDLPLDAGINDDLTTRISIQETFPEEADYFPALVVKIGNFNSVPISFNRETGSVQWDYLTFQDGYGNIKTFKTPKHFIFAGAWEGSINIDVLARDMRARDDLADLVAMRFVDIAHNELLREGIIITGVSTSGPSETDDRNSKIFKDTVILKIRTEWRRHIRVGNIVEIIGEAIEFGQLNDFSPVAANLTIHSEKTLIEVLAEL